MKERQLGMLAIAGFGYGCLEFGISFGRSGAISIGAIICMLIGGMILGGIVWSKR